MERVEKRYGIRRVEIVATVGWVREIEIDRWKGR